MELEHDDAVDPGVARTLTDLITTRVSQADGFVALSSADVKNLVELEGQKQALGCEGTTVCLAEMAGALGARFVVFGRVSPLGEQLVVNMSLLDVERVTPLKRTALQADDIGEVGARLDEAVGPLLTEARAVHAAENGIAPVEAQGTPWALYAAGGVAVLGVAAVVLGAGGAAASTYVYFTQNSAPTQVREVAPVGIAGGAAVAVLGAVAVITGGALAALSAGE